MWFAVGVGIAAFTKVDDKVVLITLLFVCLLSLRCFCCKGITKHDRLSLLIKRGCVLLLIGLGFVRSDNVFTQLDTAWEKYPVTEGKSTWIRGEVVSIEQKPQGFVVLLQATAPLDGLVRLQYYFPRDGLNPSFSYIDSAPRVGGIWEFYSSLKRPYFSENPGGFSYQQYLYRHAVVAVGSIKKFKRITGPQNALAFFRAFIFELQTSIKNALEHLEHKALLHALWLGDRSEMTAEQRALIESTGTQHLLVVSGMHLGAMVAFSMLLTAMFSRVRGLCLLGRAQTKWLRVNAILVLLLTLFYAALSGFKVPVLRALIMVWVGVFAWIRSDIVHPWFAWRIALTVVLLFDPCAVFDAGFYLSFGAVAALIAVFSPQSLINQQAFVKQVVGVNKTSFSPKAVVWKAVSPFNVLIRWCHSKVSESVKKIVKAQLAVGLILWPLSLMLELSPTPLGIFVNIWAIPWMTLWLLPISWLCMGMYFLGVAEALTWLDQQMSLFVAMLQLSVQIADGVINSIESWHINVGDGFDYILSAVAKGVWQPVLSHPLIPFGLLLLLGVALCLMLAPRSLMPYPLVLTLAFSLGCAQQYERFQSGSQLNRLPEGVFEVQVFDVGQGSAVLVRTAGGDWLVDTGPRYLSGSTQFEFQIDPYLKHLGIKAFAGVIVSHEDLDHTGGTHHLAKEYAVHQWVMPESSDSGEWQSNDVTITWFKDNQADNDNDRSWIVVITSPYGRAVIPGDIGRSTEKRLLRSAQNAALMTPVQLLLAPHHGSRQSSSWEWVKMLKPKWVVFSAGYQNPYHHPHKDVIKRYQAVGSRTLSTFATGLMVFRFDAGQSWRAPSIYRAQILGRWQRQLSVKPLGIEREHRQ